MFRGFSKRKSDKQEGVLDTPRRASAGKSELAITAPKRIVRAMYPYQAHEQDELSFNKNDFFYVTDESDPEWYVASNPLTSQSGLVPVSYFEVIQRQDPAQALSLTQAQNNQRAHSRNASVATAMSAGTAGTANTSGTERSRASLGAVSSGAAGGSRPNHRPANSQSSGRSQRSSSGASKQHLYGFVLFDFTAERNDELSVSAGESIVITAISNDEWFVAKPIGRLGGPGLIPVSYVEVREVGSDEPVENVLETVRRAGVPHVEEWKRRLAEYKASSIPLGRFGTTSEQLDVKGHQQHALPASAASYQPQPHHQPVTYTSKGHAVPLQQPQPQLQPQSQSQSQIQAQQYQQQQQQQPQPQSRHSHADRYSSNGHASNGSSNGYYKPFVNEAEPRGNPSLETLAYADATHTPFVVTASVDRFAINGGRYWYLVRAEMSNGRHRNLCRYYQDFYDFQIRLLEEFPVEAGRTGKPRSLPFMPGPLTLVTHTVSTQRRANLDDYVRELIRMPPSVSRSRVMLNLFELRPGDVEGDGPIKQLPQPPEVVGVDDELEPAIQDATEADVLQPETISPKASPPRSPQHSPQRSPRSSFNGPPSSGNTRVSSGTMQPPYLHAARPYGERSASYGRVSDSQQSLKVKVYATDNVIAIRVPAELSFNEIYDRIATRMAVPNPKLYANKDLTGEPVQTPSAFARIVNGGNKVALYLGP